MLIWSNWNVLLSNNKHSSSLKQKLFEISASRVTFHRNVSVQVTSYHKTLIPHTLLHSDTDWDATADVSKVHEGSVLRAWGGHWNWTTHLLILSHAFFYVLASSTRHLILYLTAKTQIHNKGVPERRMNNNPASLLTSYIIWDVTVEKKKMPQESVLEMMRHVWAAL